MALVASFAPSLRSGANDATRATNKQYALQKSSYCPIYPRSLRAGSLVGTENENRREEWDEEKSLFLVPFFSPVLVFRAYKWACSQAITPAKLTP